MQKTNKIKFIIIFLLLTRSIFSQNNTSSPYTQFGIGDLANKNFGRTKSMGGIESSLRSAQNINFKNPAGYTTIDTLSFVFEFGIKSKITQYKTETMLLTSDNTNIDYIAIAFPITKHFKSSIGLLPYSSIGYTIKDTASDPFIGNYTKTNYGNGGITEFYIGNSLELFNKVSLGFNVSYLFGTMYQLRSLFSDHTPNFISTQKRDKIRVSDLHLNYGIQYYDKLNEKFTYCLALTFENENKVNSEYESFTAASKTISAFYNRIVSEHIQDTIEYIKEENKSIILPRSIGVGLSLNYDKKITFGVSYEFQGWSNSKILAKTDSLINSSIIAFGLEYTPNRYSITKYYKRMNYRFGGHYTNSYIQLFDEQIKDYGISFGLGIPIKRTKSLLNVSFELGKRGTVDKNLILENYGILSLNVSLSDIWFIKRKFD